MNSASVGGDALIDGRGEASIRRSWRSRVRPRRRSQQFDCPSLEALSTTIGVTAGAILARRLQAVLDHRSGVVGNNYRRSSQK